MELYIKFIIGLIFSYGTIILNFAIFKIHISGKDKQIMILALIFGTTNFYFKFVEDSNVFLLTQVIINIIAIAILRKYPLLYATVVSVIGMIAVSVADAIATGIFTGLNVYTLTEIKENTIPFVILHCTTTIICLASAQLLIKRKIGFGFVVRKFSGKNNLKPATFMWAFILIIGLGSLQFISQNFKLLSSNGLSIVIAVFILFGCIGYAYFQNKKSLIDKFGETTKVG